MLNCWLDISEDGPGQHPVLFLKGLGCDGWCAAFPGEGPGLTRDWVKVENLHRVWLLRAGPALGDGRHFGSLGITGGWCSHWGGRVSIRMCSRAHHWAVWPESESNSDKFFRDNEVCAPVQVHLCTALHIHALIFLPFFFDKTTGGKTIYSMTCSVYIKFHNLQQYFFGNLVWLSRKKIMQEFQLVLVEKIVWKYHSRTIILSKNLGRLEDISSWVEACEVSSEMSMCRKSFIKINT